MKKSVFLIPLVILFCVLMTVAANAADYTVTTGSDLTISTVGPHTVTGTATNAHIICTVPGVTLTLNGVSVTCGSGSPISFTGAGNHMILAAGTTNTFLCTSSNNSIDNAAVKVESGTELTISGTGTLNATGGRCGAGIGGGHGEDGGTIIINSGTINATGGYEAAGIGGGAHEESGDGATSGGSGGTITINGGTVTATGGDEEGVGIGAGYGFNYTSGSWGTINITGGVVKAISNDWSRAAGIGGAYHSPAGSIAISGGLVYAMGYSVAKDIGDGGDMSSGTITISGDAAVFLARNSYSTPTLPNGHVDKLQADYNANSVYGVVVPDSSWTTAAGAFFRLNTLAYNSNGGTGTTPSTLERHYNTTTAVSSGTGLTRPGYTFSSWNTSSSGGGTVYAAGSTYTFNSLLTTLYAQWRSATTMPQTGEASPYIGLYILLVALTAALLLIGVRRNRSRKRSVK